MKTQSAPKTLEQMLNALDHCTTIAAVMELVKREHIVIQMKSQQSASSLPAKRIRPGEFNPDVSPLDRLKDQVRDALYEQYQRNRLQDVAEAVDRCDTIGEVMELVKREHIVIQMKSQQSASSLPAKRFYPGDFNLSVSPLDRLKVQVKDAVQEQYRRERRYAVAAAVDRCNSIGEVMELVRREHIVIQMKSQQSASCIPRQRFSPEGLDPTRSPLESLKQQVKEAVLNGGV